MRVGPGKAVLAAALVFGSLTGGTSAATAASCQSGQSGVGAFYPGNAASKTYEAIFAKGFALPFLSTHIPQGITVWKNWNGAGKDILILSMYRAGSDSYLIGIDPGTGRQIGTVAVAEGHLGGVAIAGNYLFGQDQDKPVGTKEPVRRYLLSKLADALTEAQQTGTKPYLGRESGLQTIAGAGFMQAYAGEIWAGHYNDIKTDKMYRYTVSPDGTLKVNGAGYEAPARTQGVLITSDRLIFNVDNGQHRGKIVVAERKHTLKNADQRCFTAPSMGQNLTRIGNRVFVVFEGGAYRFPNATNRVTDLHTGDLTKLRKL